MQKVFLQKLFLLMTFFLSGCTTTDELLEMTNGKTGVYSLGDTDCAFAITNDSKTYTDDNYLLVFNTRGYEYLTYKGYTEDGTLITVELSDLTDWGGTYNRYMGNMAVIRVGFSWAYQKK